MFQSTASWDALRLRAELLRRVRQFFDGRGFLEVQTPLLSADTVVDRHLDPIAVVLPGHEPAMWLQTSPEFAMKRLLADGGEALYQITHAFRTGERGRLHNPEFTILEWYRTGDDYEAGMNLLDEFARIFFESDDVERLKYRDAFLRHVSLDPFDASLADFAEAAAKRNLPLPTDMENADRDDWLNLLLAECIEPHLGSERPTILCNYPASQAALARISGDDARIAERFELYVRGVELANGYHELLDADELSRRNSIVNDLRDADGKQRLPEQSRLLDAMRHGLPACCGVALGFDRLVMLTAGAESIDDVMPFPIERA